MWRRPVREWTAGRGVAGPGRQCGLRPGTVGGRRTGDFRRLHNGSLADGTDNGLGNGWARQAGGALPGLGSGALGRAAYPQPVSLRVASAVAPTVMPVPVSTVTVVPAVVSAPQAESCGVAVAVRVRPAAARAPRLRVAASRAIRFFTDAAFLSVGGRVKGASGPILVGGPLRIPRGAAERYLAVVVCGVGEDR